MRHRRQERQLIIEEAKAIARLGLAVLEQPLLGVIADHPLAPWHGFAVRIAWRLHDQLIALDPAAVLGLAKTIPSIADTAAVLGGLATHRAGGLQWGGIVAAIGLCAKIVLLEHLIAKALEELSLLRFVEGV